MYKKSAALLIVFLASSCLSVSERVRRSDEEIGEPKLIGEKLLAQEPKARAWLSEGALVVDLRSAQRCQKQFEVDVQRTEHTVRQPRGAAYLMLGAEFIGGLAAGMTSLWVMSLPADEFVNGETTRLVNALAYLAGSAALLGVFSYHLFYLIDEPKESFETNKTYWTEAQACGGEVLANVALKVQYGGLVLQGKTDNKGRAKLAFPDDAALSESAKPGPRRVRIESEALPRALELALELQKVPPPPIVQAGEKNLDAPPLLEAAPEGAVLMSPDPEPKTEKQPDTQPEAKLVEP